MRNFFLANFALMSTISAMSFTSSQTYTPSSACQLWAGPAPGAVDSLAYDGGSADPLCAQYRSGFSLSAPSVSMSSTLDWEPSVGLAMLHVSLDFNDGLNVPFPDGIAAVSQYVDLAHTFELRGTIPGDGGAFRLDSPGPDWQSDIYNATATFPTFTRGRESVLAIWTVGLACSNANGIGCDCNGGYGLSGPLGSYHDEHIRMVEVATPEPGTAFTGLGGLLLVAAGAVKRAFRRQRPLFA